MRYSKRVTFVTKIGGGFNPDTGKHDKPREVRDEKACNVSTVGVDRSKELFGEIDTIVTVIRLQRPYDKQFDYIELNDEPYNVRRQSDYRRGAFYLESAN